MRKFLLNIFTLCVSLTVSLLLAEIMVRWFFNPIDYLKPKLIPDEYLGYRIEPGSADYDEWGFRNFEIPKKADIVVIGDSQTFGVGESIDYSYPWQLADISGQSVYNLALGGYGPAQYYYLLEKYALQLQPKIIVIGHYPGNDYLDAYEMAYEYPAYQQFKVDSLQLNRAPVRKADRIVKANKVYALSNVRDWLGNKSVLYRILTLTFASRKIEQLKDKVYEQNYTYIENLTGDFNTGFKVGHRFNEINLDDKRVTIGFDITVKFFEEIKSLCEQNNIRLIITIIPTKESIYWEYIKPKTALTAYEKFKKIDEYESALKDSMKIILEHNGIEFIDLLDDFRKAIVKEAVFHENFDDHPNKNGYRIIAENIWRKINPDL